MQLVQLQKDLKQIKATGTQLVGISYDSTATLGEFAKKQKISFPLLSDKDSKVIDAFGVRNEEARGRGNGIPHPATFVIDKHGKIRAKLPGTVRRRHDTQRLLQAIKEIEP